jgi:hypothetical protein
MLLPEVPMLRIGESYDTARSVLRGQVLEQRS